MKFTSIRTDEPVIIPPATYSITIEVTEAERAMIHTMLGQRNGCDYGYPGYSGGTALSVKLWNAFAPVAR